jgi:hypothetical protein
MTDNTSIKTWQDWFNSRGSGKIINKSNQEKLFSTFNLTISKLDCIKAIIQHEETVFLYKVNFGTNKVNMFHHLMSVGGTIYNTSPKDYGFIEGIGKSTSLTMTPDIEILCDTPAIMAPVPIPSTTQLLSVTNQEQLQDLTESATVTYKARNFIPVPPFLLNSVNNAISNSNGQAEEVILNCIKSIKDFDMNHAADVEYVDKARSKCKDILFWLYLVTQNSPAILATPSMGCSNEAMASQVSKISEKHLNTTSNTIEISIATQVESSLKRPFEVLAASSSSTSEFMEKLTQLQSSNNDKSTKSFRKVPSKYQNMILVASSTGEVTELEYSAEVTEFFKCSNTLNAQVMLNSQFETANIECSASSAVTKKLMYGSFIWRNALSPSGFAASVLTSEGIFLTDTLHEGMVLDYATKFDMSSASLNKLTKTQVLYPSDAEETIQQVKGIHKLAQFFFKKGGYMSQGLKKLSNFCIDNKMLLCKMIYMDSQFTAKLICAINERIYLWLQQCSSNDCVLDTDTSLMDFSP